jgi:enterochelin esterase-like enzyme
MKFLASFYTVLFLFVFSFSGCKSTIKELDDQVYSRHLQRQVPLKIVTTPMPDKKEEMNLLLMNSIELLDQVEAKRIIDSLYKKKQIQPLTLVAFEGKKENYGIVNTGKQADDAKEFKQFNDFIIKELYPFIKKKVVIRKFNSVATCGFGASAKNAFYSAFHNDDKIQTAGLFYPQFDAGEIIAIRNSRNQASLDLMLVTATKDSTTDTFTELHNGKPTIINNFEYALPSVNSKKEMPTPATFAKFLVWAFKVR